MAYDASINSAIAASIANMFAMTRVLAMSTQEALDQFGQDFVEAMQERLSHPGSGEPGPYNTRSAPGEPPAPQTETYRDSWSYSVKAGVSGAELLVGSPEEYGAFLEMGTSMMEPRPHLRPQVEEMRGRLTGQIIMTGSAAQVSALKGLLTPTIIEVG